MPRLHERLVHRPLAEVVEPEAVEPADGDGEDRQDDERHGDGRRRLVGVAVAPELAEEREPHAAGHVGGGHERADEADDHEERVAVLAGAERGSRPWTRSRRSGRCRPARP